MIKKVIIGLLMAVASFAIVSCSTGEEECAHKACCKEGEKCKSGEKCCKGDSTKCENKKGAECAHMKGETHSHSHAHGNEESHEHEHSHTEGKNDDHDHTHIEVKHSEDHVH